MNDTNRQDESRIEGKNAVIEALRAGRALDKVFLARGEQDKALRFIAQKAKAQGAVISEVDRHKLDAMSVTHAHQGVIAVAALREYDTLESILELAESRGEKPHGIVIPKHRSAGITAIVEKTSAGAVEHMAVARVPNLSAALEKLKKVGLWVFGTAAEGDRSLWEADLTEGTVIVIGSEGAGMSRMTRESCDFLVSIPMHGKVSSLNASAAAAVILYEAVRQRSKINR